jgi:hypothetical protein
MSLRPDTTHSVAGIATPFWSHSRHNHLVSCREAAGANTSCAQIHGRCIEQHAANSNTTW